MLRALVATIALGVFVVTGLPGSVAVSGETECKETKAKAAGKKAFDLLKAFGKNTKKSNSAKLAQDTSKAQSKFTKEFTKAEANGQCLTSGDSEAIEVKVDAFVEDAMAEVSGLPTTTMTTSTTTTTTLWTLCDPGSEVFDYGEPRQNTEAEQISLEMLGAVGPLLPPDEIYDRIVRDLGLIRAEDERLEDQTHTPAWAPNELLVEVTEGLPHDDYECLNAHYQVISETPLVGECFRLTFAGNANVVALGAIYEAAPEVQYAEPNHVIGGQNSWTPADLGAGVWHWSIDDGWWDCIAGCGCHRYYELETNLDGQVKLISVEEAGGPWCEF